MATTSIMPLHTGSGRSVAKALKDSIDYMKNPLKTEDGELITSYQCDARTADTEFLLSKQRYASLTGRDQGKNEVIAYHIRQSFKPGEITPEEANRIGYELAMRFTKGKHGFIVCTHTDKQHIHNHIVWDSTALDCQSKFRNFIGSAFALRRLSDMICLENGLSVVENPKPSRGRNYGQWLGEAKPLSYQDRLRQAIDIALEKKPGSFEDFLSLMRDSGYTVNERGKHITFLAPGQKKPTRCDTLRGEYTESAIRERIGGMRVSAPGGRASETPTPAGRQKSRPNLLIDIPSRMREGKGQAYQRWAKIHNLKQMAKTLIYLQENGLGDYTVLQERAAAVTERHHGLSDRLKELEATLVANAELQRQIVTYSKTRAVYVEYRKAGYAPSFRARHEADILLHQAAKKTFDELGLKKLPTVASLRAEYATALEEKRAVYLEYQVTRTEMRELLTAKSNIDTLLHITDPHTERGAERMER